MPSDHAALRRLAEAKGSPDLLLSSSVVLALLDEIARLAGALKAVETGIRWAACECHAMLQTAGKTWVRCGRCLALETIDAAQRGRGEETGR